MELETHTEGAVRPKGEQPEIKPVIRVFNVGHIVDNSVFAPHFCCVNLMAGVSCCSAKAEKYLFWASGVEAGESPLLRDWRWSRE